MAKSLCKRDKLLKKDFEAYAAMVVQPSFICADCGRAANKKKYLCEPKKIPDSVAKQTA